MAVGPADPFGADVNAIFKAMMPQFTEQVNVLNIMPQEAKVLDMEADFVYNMVMKAWGSFFTDASEHIRAYTCKENLEKDYEDFLKNLHEWVPENCASVHGAVKNLLDIGEVSFIEKVSAFIMDTLDSLMQKAMNLFQKPCAKAILEARFTQGVIKLGTGISQVATGVGECSSGVGVFNGLASIIFGVNTVIEGAQDCFYGIKEIIAMCKGDAKALEEAQSAKSVNVLKEATGHKLDRTLDLCELLSGSGALLKSLRSAKVGEKLIEGLSKIRSAFERLRQIGKLARIEAKNMVKFYRREVGNVLYQRKMPRLSPVSGPPGRMINSSWKEMFEEESKAANVLERKAVGEVGSKGANIIEKETTELLDSLFRDTKALRSSPASYYSYNELHSLIKKAKLSGRCKGLEAHHLLEKQFASIFGIAEGDIISTPLTPLWHRGVNGEKILLSGENIDALINRELKDITGASSVDLAKKTANADQIWQSHRNVYHKIGHEDWANAIYEAYVKKLKIKY